MSDLAMTDGIGGKGEPRFANRLLELGRVRELGAKSAEYLATVVADAGTIRKHRIAAARALLAYHQYREDRFDKRREQDPLVILRGVLGSDERLLAFFEEHYELVKQRVAGKALAAKKEGPDAG